LIDPFKTASSAVIIQSPQHLSTYAHVFLSKQKY